MKRVASAAAALGALAALSAPAFARTTMADFGSGGDRWERLFAHAHRHKPRVVVTQPGDDSAASPTTSTGATTPVEGTPPDISIDPR